jgi:GalNAc-alpha-(1->4)-GalNAc-alpha-(1->3)-diNAcBac-PP-undecaprenol alpha-1,4-N-acetyl-D-galactosaminyltransferase
MKVNLIFFLTNFSKGGAANSITRLCQKLSTNKDYSVTILSIGKNPYKKKLNKSIKLIQLKNKRLIFSIPQLYKKVKKIILSNNKNILISNIHYNNIISVLLFRKIRNLKIILVERTPVEELDIIFPLKYFFKNQLIKLLIKIVYNYADQVIANSNGIKKGLKKLTSSKIKVIYPPSIKNINISRQVHKVKNIIVISRLSYEKKIEVIINAFSILKEKSKLYIYGDGPEKKSLQKLIKYKKLEDKVFLKNYTNNPNKILKKSALFISSSIFEGCSNAIIEAINNSNIILCSNCPGGNSEIILNEKGGTFFNTNDIHDLSKKISSIFKNPEKYQKKTLYAKKFLNRFTFDQNFLGYERVFKNIK